MQAMKSSTSTPARVTSTKTKIIHREVATVCQALAEASESGAKTHERQNQDVGNEQETSGNIFTNLM